mgnify:CR=1 FL=1
MQLSSFVDLLKQKLKEELPGMEAHLTMTPYRRLTKVIPDNHKKSAVMILLYEKEGEIYFPLIQRQDYKGVHSGQISFPGGKMDKTDSSLLETAFRETEEEVGIDRTELSYIGELTELYIPPSNFMVHVYVSFHSGTPSFVKEEKEVKEILEVPYSSVMDDGNIKETEVLIQGGMKLKTPYLDLNDKVVWGATAAILVELGYTQVPSPISE